MAWAGRVFEFPVSQPQDPAGVFVQADPFGPRLVRIEALVDRERGVVVRPPVIVAEQRLGDVRSVPGQATIFVMQTSVAPVAVTVRDEGPDSADTPGTHSFVVRNEGGQVLLRATVSREDVDAVRARWQQWIRGAVSLVLALTLLACAAAVLDVRRIVRRGAAVIGVSALLAGFLVGARLALRSGGSALSGVGWLVPPWDLLFTALLLLALAWLAAGSHRLLAPGQATAAAARPERRRRVDSGRVPAGGGRHRGGHGDLRRLSWHGRDVRVVRRAALLAPSVRSGARGDGRRSRPASRRRGVGRGRGHARRRRGAPPPTVASSHDAGRRRVGPGRGRRRVDRRALGSRPAQRVAASRRHVGRPRGGCARPAARRHPPCLAGGAARSSVPGAAAAGRRDLSARCTRSPPRPRSG